METKNKLQIILITYNRKKFLEKTFNQIFSADSPIKDFDIIVLDNCSTDGSSEFIAEYCQKFQNVKHIRHNKNIGGNANIVRAFEIASKEYVWILCDDDKYDFSHWDEVEDGLKEHPDALVVAHYMEPLKNICRLLKQLTFVPAAIYKTSNITDTVMINANYNISNMFPQLAIVCAILNAGANITFTKYPVVTMVLNTAEESSYVRGAESGYPHRQMKKMFWEQGYLNSLNMIEDKKLRRVLMKDMHPENGNFSQIVRRVLSRSEKDKKISFYYLLGLDTEHFFKFIMYLFCIIEKRERGYYVILFNSIKFKIWPVKKHAK